MQFFLHPQVLILAEDLQRATAVFDSFRMQRYHQMKLEEQKKKRTFRVQESALHQSSSKTETLFTGNTAQQQVLIEENQGLVVSFNVCDRAFDVWLLAPCYLMVNCLHHFANTLLSFVGLLVTDRRPGPGNREICSRNIYFKPAFFYCNQSASSSH
jgi:hypothetical protein